MTTAYPTQSQSQSQSQSQGKTPSTPARTPIDEINAAIDANITSPHATHPVLLATDGLGATSSPAVVARLVAERHGRPLKVVTAIEPVMVYAGSAGLAPVPMLLDETFGTARESAVTQHLAEIWPRGTQYSLDTRYGPVSYAIAGGARETNAELLVVGAAPHRLRHRIMSGVLASQVLRQVTCPVLSVAPGLDHLPRNIIVATDFGAASIRAAREALRLLAPEGRVTLVSVIPLGHLDALIPMSLSANRADAERLLEKLQEHLEPWLPKDATMSTYVAEGIPGDEIVALAERREADLVAVGTHGPGFVERFFVGSVATNVLHGVPCSVLASPPPSAGDRASLELSAWGAVESDDKAAWPSLLDDFSRRNVGRRLRLEVDEPRLGAQVQATGYTLQGTTYDPQDRRVDVMLALRTEPTQHLTRSITGVKSMAVTRAQRGPKDAERDTALQIRTESGDTLLVFESQ